jgi:hypothetical protein
LLIGQAVAKPSSRERDHRGMKGGNGAALGALPWERRAG